TVTVNELVAVLWWASVAMSVTVVVPSGNVLPEAWLATTVTAPSTMSVAVALKLTAAPLGLVASATMATGVAMTGGVVSTTVTLKEPVAGLPAASVAVTVTVLVPSGKTLPGA